MTDSPLIAHSLAEARLYLLATPCEKCGNGPLRADEPTGDAAGLSIPAKCAGCGHAQVYTFRLIAGTLGDASPAEASINTTAEPSRILDLAQWVILSGMIVERAGRESNKQSARRLLIEAALCLEEALKFFEDDNDLPPPSAFFHRESRERFRTHPDPFSRPRLLHLRSRLPHAPG